jgi:predicted O-methyltransferase YrrM
MHTKSWIVGRLRRSLRSEFNLRPTRAETVEIAQAAYRQAEAYCELLNRLPGTRLRQMRGYAVSPDACLQLIDLVEATRPRLVVELGSGLSTLAIAAALRQWSPDGRIVSIDHSVEYADRTRGLIAEHALVRAEVRIAKLADTLHKPSAGQWYDEVAFRDLDDIDLLFIDGPPAPLGRHARSPSLPVLGGRVAQGGLVILDDTLRGDDLELAERWAAAVDGKLEHVKTEKGLAVIKYPTAMGVDAGTCLA